MSFLRSFCRLQAKIVKTLFFVDSLILFNVFFVVLGSQNRSKIVQNRSEGLLGHQSWPQECAKSGLGSSWETNKMIWKAAWRHLRRQGGDNFL